MNQLAPMPQNKEAESEVLGLIINNPKSANEIIGILKPKDFYTGAHQAIYECMEKLYSENKIIEIVALAEELRKQNKLQEAGGVTYLAQLAGSVMASDNIKEYARIVKEKSNKREIIRTAQNMMSKAYDDKSEVKEILGETEDSIYAINIEKENRMIDIKKAVLKTIQIIEDRLKKGKGLTGVSTGFSDMDKISNGLKKGDMIILAARPSMGKTAFALNIGGNVSKSHFTAIFSLEMSEEQLTQRMLSSFSMIDLNKIMKGQLGGNEWDQLARASNMLQTRNLMIDDTAGLTVNEIKAKCKKLKIKNSLDVVIIDYLGLIEPSGKSQSREQEISKISRSLKRLAKELDIAVITLCQLSRAPETRANHRPILSDLRESGSIEQDADMVWFLYRDEYYNAESEDKGIAECIVAKNRNGEVGTVKLTWRGEYQRFGTIERFRG